MMHLSEKALLVNLSISQWVGRKLDKAASAEITKIHGAVEGSSRVNKSLLPTCDVLDRIKSKTGAIRNRFYDNTLPWGIEGTYILPSGNYLAYVTEYRKDKSEWDGLCDQFFLDYNQACDDAKLLLGSLYKEGDYPRLGELRRKFSMDMAVLPVPTAGDFRVELADGEFATVQSEIEKRVKESSQAAMKDVWQRLYDKVEWISARLNDPDKQIHASAYQDAKDTCELLSRLNFTDDPNLEQMRSDVESKIFSHHVQSIRNDPDVRRDAAAEVNAIMDKMAVFMEGV